MREKIEEVIETIGEVLADAILQVCSSEEMRKLKKDFGFKQESKDFEREYFYLMIFLSTLACQIVFIKDEQLTKEVLDTFHKNIMEKKFNLPEEILQARVTEVQLNNRDKQYRELLKTKQSDFDLGFLIQQIPYDFLANVLEKDLNYIFNDKECKQRYGKAVIFLGLYVGKVLNELTDRLTKIKEKYIKTL